MSVRAGAPGSERGIAARMLDRQIAEMPVEIRVFLVEDLRSTQGLMHELFSSLGGFRIVSTAITEAEANLWLEENPTGWDFAVVDLVLEQGTGMGVIARARSFPAAGKIVAFSSYASPGVRNHCLRLGADAVFDKSDPAGFIQYCVGLAERENSGPSEAGAARRAAARKPPIA